MSTSSVGMVCSSLDISSRRRISALSLCLWCTACRPSRRVESETNRHQLNISVKNHTKFLILFIFFMISKWNNSNMRNETNLPFLSLPWSAARRSRTGPPTVSGPHSPGGTAGPSDRPAAPTRALCYKFTRSFLLKKLDSN